ncbi:MAG: rhamnogalacturonan lyase [Sedimentisphaerales bacterium]|nr:rhamnogalacturonan lyase [Sedimentisphaerales bacterium]MBN2843150.1 rhamnogalacturonan lyase [Sedimentisphaerales bacterium]
MNKWLYFVYFISTITVSVCGRSFETLDRGAVAISLPDGGNYISWRLLNTDSTEIAFDIYRGEEKLNSEPVKLTTDYKDHSGTIESRYRIEPVGCSGSISAENIRVWPEQYIEIPLSPPVCKVFPGQRAIYRPGDASVGDLDGDGKYEIVLKWEAITHDNSQKGYTSNTWLEGLELTGKSLWKIDLGINIRSGAHYNPFVVFDLNLDGKAEIICKTGDGTTDGKGNIIGNSTDYRDKNGYILAGPEYLTVFCGQTGEIIDTTEYVPARGDISYWGDRTGNRVDRYLAAAGWLGNDRPSAIMARGYYHGKTGPGRTALTAWDLKNGKLVKRWSFDTIDGSYDNYIGQGNHSMYVADVDGDGFDEITYGSCAVDHDGKGLYSTGLGHGDAGHLTDLDPDRPGLEFFMPHEEASPGQIPGIDFRDAQTGQVIWSVPVNKRRDIGRGLAGDIYAGSPGGECWSLLDRNLYSCKGEIIGESPATCNFLIWWDGDKTRELLDRNWIGKYQPGEKGNIRRIFTAEDCTWVNGTKATPSLTADILGDWREELIIPRSDGLALRIYTTTIPADNRQTTLMHDPIYRLGIVWQNSGYNQPPHTSK